MKKKKKKKKTANSGSSGSKRRKILRAGFDTATATAFPRKGALDLLGSVFRAREVNNVKALK